MHEIRKLDESKGLVYGWANIVADADGELIEDLQGDLIEPGDLEDAVVKFMLDHRASGEMHQGEAGGRVIESLVASPEKFEAMGIPKEVAKTMPTGYWIGVKVSPETFAKVKDGTYQAFSIEGTAVKEPV